MNVNEAIKYLILLADRYHSKGHGEYEPDGDFLIGVTKLLEQWPQTGDLEEEIAAAMDKYEGEVIVNTRLRDSIRWKNIIINRLNQRLSGMGGQC